MQTRRLFLMQASFPVACALSAGRSVFADVGGAEQAAKRGRVIASCTKHWPDNKGDCSAFVRAVSHDLGLDLTGLANAIYDQIATAPWTRIGIGPAAATIAGVTAGEGKLVIGASKGQNNGHVAVIVDYRNAFDSYSPVDRDKAVAFWGKLHSVGQGYTRVTQSWTEADMQNVLFAYRPIP